MDGLLGLVVLSGSYHVGTIDNGEQLFALCGSAPGTNALPIRSARPRAANSEGSRMRGCCRSLSAGLTRRPNDDWNLARQPHVDAQRGADRINRDLGEAL
jgi:hypothetical protein